jgi:hypothetical protein
MAKIFLSYGQPDRDFARSLASKLRSSGHEIVLDVDSLAPGQDWRYVLTQGLRTADALIVLLSEASLASHYVSMEIGLARAYANEAGKPLIIRVVIDNIQIPPPFQDIQILFATDRNIDRIFLEVSRSLALAEAQNAAREKKAEEVAKKIESNASEYIDDAIRVQRRSEAVNGIWGKLWYFVGFLVLLIGIGFALISLNARTSDSNWTDLAAVVLTNLIVIGFLGACSRYAFSLGKAYTSESLKASDRIHAIAFGKFYLQAFGEKANWSELKEVF